MFGEKQILILEDECFTALDLANAVQDWNGRVVGPFATVAEALTVLESQKVAAAILDAKLADRDVTPVAIRLAEQGVPFVIHTGTGIPDELAAELPELPVVMKPVKPIIVLACLLNEMTEPPIPVVQPMADETQCQSAARSGKFSASPNASRGRG